MTRGAGAVVGMVLLAACGAQPPPRSATPTCARFTPGQMQWIPPGSFVMGDRPHYPEEGPPRRVDVAGFWMDTHEVTNAEFAAFVAATGYSTLAERAPPALPGAPSAMRVPGSAVFAVPSRDDPRWWRWVVGAQWRHPDGPGHRAEPSAGPMTDHGQEPVVQIGYADVAAYARWAHKAIPTEAQWEYAARAGQPPREEPVDRDGRPTANTYQGVFPVRNLATDGYVGRAPVGCFAPNAFGLYDMIGNVWEWTRGAGDRTDTGVIKGGSFLCAASYCARYRPAARQFQERGLGTDHIGFRLIDDRRPPPGD